MKVAIFASGSLLWEKGHLALANDWAPGGPGPPLEFSRVSSTRDGALTLVIDPKNGVEIPTYFAVSSHQNLDEAIHNLREREDTGAMGVAHRRAEAPKPAGNGGCWRTDPVPVVVQVGQIPCRIVAAAVGGNASVAWDG